MSRAATPPADLRAARRRAIPFFLAAACAMALATLLAARAYPDGFDWVYSVISRLASRKHNPAGGRWFAGGLCVSMALLWPVVGFLERSAPARTRRPRVAAAALRIGVACMFLVGVERLFVHHLSDVVRKGHELLALLGFLGIYVGTLTQYGVRVHRDPALRWSAALVVLPLVAVGINQLALYVDQRDLGWVDVGWREQGIPFWRSFAFWQWVSAVMLWVGIGHLVLARPRERSG